jgi:L-fuconolactonase
VRPPRIDAHQHFWRYDPVEYDWIDERMTAIRRDFLPPDLRPEIAAAGIERTVAVQARQTLEETRWLLQLAGENDFIAGVIGWVDLQADDVEAQLEALAAHPRLLGVRHVVQSEAPGFMASSAFRRGMQRLGGFDLTYDILIYARQLSEAIELVRAFPNQRFVVDHAAKPDIAGGGLDVWRKGIEELAAEPHVWCKLSGLVTEAVWNTWTPDQLKPYIETTFECFGAARLMVGSDWPVCTVASTYGTTIRTFEDALRGCSAEERDSIFGLTAKEFWNLREQ